MAALNQDQDYVKALRRRKIADMLMQQGAESLPTSNMVGDVVVPVTGLQAANKVIQQLSGAYIGKKADEDLTAINQQNENKLSNIDFTSQDAAKNLILAGYPKEAIALEISRNKTNTQPQKFGFTRNEDGSITPAPMTTGGNFADYELNKSAAVKMAPGYGDAERLQLAKDASQYQKEQDIKQQDIQKRGQDIQKRGQDINAAKQSIELSVDDNGKLVYTATGGNTGKKLAQKQIDQIIGAENTIDAINSYQQELDKFKPEDVLSPDAQAIMGTKYTNMIAQAKEAYGLGAPTGPDMKLLHAIITTPVSFKGAITSKKALNEQAIELTRIMKNISKNARRTYRPSNDQEIPVPSELDPKLSDPREQDPKYQEWLKAKIAGGR